MALTLLRKTNSTEIQAYHDAAVFYTLLGNCILKDCYTGCKATYSSNVVKIGAGFIMFGGRLIEISQAPETTLDLSSFDGYSTIYIKLKITINADDSLSEAVLYASTDSTESGVDEPIISAGEYTINLYSCKNSGDGSIKVLIYEAEASVARYAHNLPGNGTINGQTISSYFESNSNYVVNARRADVATEAEGFTGGDINRVSSNLYMPNRGVYLMTSTSPVSLNMTVSSSGSSEARTSLASQKGFSSFGGEVRAYISGALVPGLAKILANGDKLTSGVVRNWLLYNEDKTAGMRYYLGYDLSTKELILKALGQASSYSYSIKGNLVVQKRI